MSAPLPPIASPPSGSRSEAVTQPRSREVWGPSAWRIIHWVAFNQPARLASLPWPAAQGQLSTTMRGAGAGAGEGAVEATVGAWFALLANLVPCSDCCRHLRARLAAMPPPEQPRRTGALAAWTVRLHNSVNAELGKPHVSFAAARAAFKGRPLAWDQARPLLQCLAATCGSRDRGRLAALLAPLGFPLGAEARRSRAALARALLGSAAAVAEEEACAVCENTVPSSEQA